MPDIQIGILGGPGSGKSTYLASLREAALRDDDNRWTISGAEEIWPGSIAYLVEQTRLLRQKRFPPASNPDAVTNVGYHIGGTLGPRFFRALAENLGYGGNTSTLNIPWFAKEFSFLLLFKDVGGIRFLSTDPQDEMWLHLAQCDGLVYLYDPILDKSDLTNLTNFDYLELAVQYIAYHRRMASEKGLFKLPQFIAVCLSKCDNAETLNELRGWEMIVSDSRGRPYIEDPGEAFFKIADDRTKQTIKRYFDSNRTRYFAISSIGFYDAPDGSGIASNTDAYDDKTILGSIEPFNVLAPLVWLYNSIQDQKKHDRM